MDLHTGNKPPAPPEKNALSCTDVAHALAGPPTTAANEREKRAGLAIRGVADREAAPAGKATAATARARACEK